MIQEFPVDIKAILEKRLGIDELEKLSKRRIIKMLINLYAYNCRLQVELFCANPDHPVFAGLTEAELAPLRMERLRRFE